MAEDISEDFAMLVKVKVVYVAEALSGSAAPVVILEDEGGRILPIFVGLSEAISIHQALTGDISPRPMTHDLFISVLENLNASIKGVLIDDLDAGVYYARLTLAGTEGESEIDARPSDCLALALRAKAPIRVKPTVVDASEIQRSEVEGLKGIEEFIR